MFVFQSTSIMRSEVTSEDSLSKHWDEKEPCDDERSLRRTSRRIARHNLRNSKSSRTTTPREKTLRRLESNERERMRMHSLNDAFQVIETELKLNFGVKTLESIQDSIE